MPEAVRGSPTCRRTARSRSGRGSSARSAERRGVVFNDLTTVQLSDPLLSRAALRSLIGAPLGIEGRLFGVLLVGTRRHRQFVETDLDFLQIVADRFALAIDQARLYEAEQMARREAAQAGYAVRQRDEFLSVAATS